MAALSFSSRVRDLVHSFVPLTELERRAIDHPLTQRLRQIRQNDVASAVYPSLNISRFEHSLGTAHVAGRMANNIVSSPHWEEYARLLKLDPLEFVQLCRMYGLLHDIGHLPLSHLFELAFERYLNERHPTRKLSEACEEWFAVKGFAKLHEACGAALAGRLLDDVCDGEPIKDPLLRLMTSKRLRPNDPLVVVKHLIDSEIDADRIDSTARDGKLAGGEYGSYDIERLCSAVFLHRMADQATWTLCYSTKALGSIEALLLDRYRTHTWIHFHPRVVGLKCAMLELVKSLLSRGVISKRDFPVDKPNEMALVDDVWLWSRVRSNLIRGDRHIEAAQKAVLYRDRSQVFSMWKRRRDYIEWYGRLKQAAHVDSVNPTELAGEYERKLTEYFGSLAYVFWLRFEPLGNAQILLTEDNGKSLCGDLKALSALTESLIPIWKGEPHFYVILLGDRPTSLDDERKLRDAWVWFTADWLQGRQGAGSPRRAQLRPPIGRSSSGPHSS